MRFLIVFLLGVLLASPLAGSPGPKQPAHQSRLKVTRLERIESETDASQDGLLFEVAPQKDGIQGPKVSFHADGILIPPQREGHGPKGEIGDLLSGPGQRACFFVVKRAVDAYDCGCVLLDENDSIKIIPRLNAWAEKAILKTKRGSRTFGTKLDLSASWIEEVKGSEVHLLSSIFGETEADNRFLEAVIRVSPAGNLSLISWEVD